MTPLDPKRIEALRKEWIAGKPETFEKNRAGSKWSLLAKNYGRLFQHHLELWMLYWRTGVGDPVPAFQSLLAFLPELEQEINTLSGDHPQLGIWENADWATSSGLVYVIAGQPEKAKNFLIVNEEHVKEAPNFMYEALVLKMILGGDPEPLWSKHWEEYTPECALMAQTSHMHRALIEACRTGSPAVKDLLELAARNYLGRKKDSFFIDGPSSGCGGPYNDIMVDLALSAIIKHFKLGPVQGLAAIHEWKA